MLNPLECISLLDLTSLNEDDDQETILHLCEKAQVPFHPVAAVCIHPQFIPIAKKELHQTGISIATVVNFPSGKEDLIQVLKTIDDAQKMGANEIDIVFPYQTYWQGDRTCFTFVSQCRKAINPQTRIKVILESGEWRDQHALYDACIELLMLNIDFLKTSTGKSQQGATLPACETIITAIEASKTKTGIKLSGGIRTYQQVKDYLCIIENVKGAAWITPNHVRFGASQLLDDLLTNSHGHNTF